MASNRTRTTAAELGQLKDEINELLKSSEALLQKLNALALRANEVQRHQNDLVNKLRRSASKERK